MIRLFIAFPLAVEVTDYLGNVIADLKPHTDSIRWVTPKNIHLTARFLGDTEESTVPKLKELIDTVAHTHASLSSSLVQLGAFPNLKRPRVVWAGISDGADKLGQIARDIEQRVRKLRFEPDSKPFKSHLTLGRVREGARLDRFGDQLQAYQIKPIPVQFDSLVLFKSTLTQQGPIYDRLHNARLAGPRD
jgi:2'-5' RNA ligase